MRKEESSSSSSFYGTSVATTALLSVVLLVLAVWLSTVLRSPSSSRQNSISPVHVVTETQPIPISTTTTTSIWTKRVGSTTSKQITHFTPLNASQREQCYRSCRLELVESLPEDLTFSHTVKPAVGSTHESWTKLIRIAEKRITMAAYKSSFRGKHVLDQEYRSAAKLGDDIYDLLKSASLQRGVRLEAVENYPPKDRGDNEDASALSELGLLERRRLNIGRLFRGGGGVMHSKFLLSDDKHFYLGSANFDWRSLNQKMELGVHAEDCPCLANDLRILYDAYWAAANEDNDQEQQLNPGSLFQDLPALTSKSNPLIIRVGDADTEVHLAASPRQLIGQKREWDLEAIVNIIDEAKDRLRIHVMDYVPMFTYQKPRKFWPVIDDAIRRAVIDRGVRVKFLTAALHFAPESLYALRSLQLLGNAVSNGGKVDVKILNIPAVTATHRAFARERRTHRKFVLNDDTLLIGTSNWSGDYFVNTTGVAIVMRQRLRGTTDESTQQQQQPLIDQAEQLFERDWNSIYASDLDEYIDRCYDKDSRRDLCKAGRMEYQQVSVNLPAQKR